MAKKTLKYSGKLAQPIRLSDVPSRPIMLSELGSKSVAIRAKEEADWLAEQVWERLTLLFDHYGIADRTNYRSLALHLAFDHVEAFQIKRKTKKSGPATFWTESMYCELLATVELLKIEHRCRDSKACFIIATAPRFSKKAWNQRIKQSKRSLETRLSEARNPAYNWLAGVLVEPSDQEFDETMREHLLRSHGLDPALSYGVKPSQN